LNIPVSLRLALRFSFSKTSGTFSSYATFLAIGGLSIGVCALILTSSIINGFDNIISEKLSNIEGSGRLVNIFGKTININEPVIDSLIHSKPNLITPFTNGIALLRFGSKAEGIIIEGLDKAPPSLVNTYGINDGSIILGKGIAVSLNINVNDKVYLQSLSSSKPLSTIPKIKSFNVKGFFYSGLQEYDRSLAYVSLNDSRSLLSMNEGEISGLIFHDEKRSSKVEVQYPYYYQNWKEKHELLFEWISLQRWPAYLMFGLIAIVGLVNLVAAISMIIIEKTKQIGILLAQGMPKSVLQHLFIIQGGFIGLIGSLFGGGLASVIIIVQLKYKIIKIPSDIYFMDQIPVSFDYLAFFVILMISIVLSLFVSWFPVRKLSNLEPAHALRY